MRKANRPAPGDHLVGRGFDGAEQHLFRPGSRLAFSRQDYARCCGVVGEIAVLVQIDDELVVTFAVALGFIQPKGEGIPASQPALSVKRVGRDRLGLLLDGGGPGRLQ